MSRRPYKFTRKRQKQYLQLLKEGKGRCKAAEFVGLNIKTIEREVDKGGAFLEERDAAESYATDEVEESFFGQTKTSPVAAQKWLEAKRPEVWSPKKEVIPGSSPKAPLYVAPGHIDWDAIPEDLAERFLTVHAEIVALQPASGGLVEGTGKVME